MKSKLSTKLKALILKNLEYKTRQEGKIFHIVWSAGEVIYNVEDMETQIWTKAQEQDLDRRFDDLEFKLNNKIDAVEERLNKRIDEVENRLNKKIDLVEERLNKRIDDVEDRLNKKIDALEEKLTKRIDKLEADVEILKQDMVEVKRRIGKLESDMTEVKQNVNQILIILKTLVDKK